MATQLKRNLDCSEEEWAVRQELAACYRIFDMLGWSESIYNHISAKVPGEDDAFLINPFGLLYSEVCASNLVKIDIDGNTLDGSPYPVNKAGFTQHAYFHRHLDWAHAICHTHTTATMAALKAEWHGAWAMIVHALTTAPFYLAVGGFLLALYLYVFRPDLPGRIKQRLGVIPVILERK